MLSPVPNRVKKIWDQWNLRGFVILSLSLQTFLILCAPFRKRTSTKRVVFPVWLAYLLADWAANFAIGLISSSQGDNRHGIGSEDDGDLLAFWAPFLLLHLGGPDTIIAIAIEDNALWPRHLLGLIFQVLAAVYVFIQSYSHNQLRVPTFLLFVAGIFKYAERTRALYLASLDGIKETMFKLKKPDPGPNYQDFMEEYSSRKNAQLPIKTKMAEDRKVSNRVVESKEEKLDKDIALVRKAYFYFAISKGLVIGVPFSFQRRNESRLFFLEKVTSEEAFKLIATELNFIYESLYTKVVVVHSKLGYFSRAISFVAICIALAFFRGLDKQRFQSSDVKITYNLLYGAIGLDSISLFKLIVSDWMVATLKTSWQSSWMVNIVKKYLNLKRSSCSTKSSNFLEWSRQILFRRWSESVSTFNLIEYSLKECQIGYCGVSYRAMSGFLGFKDLQVKMKYMSEKPLTENLWGFIFKELRSKSLLAEDPRIGKKICSARGELVLREHHCNHLLTYIVDFNYDKSLLLWHIATEVCYNSADDGNGSTDDDDYCGLREYSKTLSDYMLHLLVMQPTIMSSLARIGQMEFQDTCAEAKRFFRKREKLEKACKRILSVNTDFKPAAVKGELSKSVLFDGCILAKELKRKKNKWNIISEVWVELLSYAASHCRENSHGDMLSKGGELVTFVWLLMTHFGIAEQFEVKEDLSKLILMVGK